jgi:hypothetical protein
VTRLLTVPEIHRLLLPVFRNTLKYHSIRCSINEANIGGVNNSLTPAGIPYFSQNIYCADFSLAGANDQWVFVHEMTHVWQWQHGIYPVMEALGLVITHRHYQKAYPYDLTPGKELEDYNIEQQASIIADYWGLFTRKLTPQYNKDLRATLSDYTDLIEDLHKSGPPTPELDRIPL